MDEESNAINLKAHLFEIIPEVDGTHTLRGGSLGDPYYNWEISLKLTKKQVQAVHVIQDQIKAQIKRDENNENYDI